jgi:hypothetical protein
VFDGETSAEYILTSECYSRQLGAAYSGGLSSLEKIAQDNLYDAVLGDDQFTTPGVRAAPPRSVQDSRFRGKMQSPVPKGTLANKMPSLAA